MIRRTQRPPCSLPVVYWFYFCCVPFLFVIKKCEHYLLFLYIFLKAVPFCYLIWLAWMHSNSFFRKKQSEPIQRCAEQKVTYDDLRVSRIVDIGGEYDIPACIDNSNKTDWISQERSYQDRIQLTPSRTLRLKNIDISSGIWSCICIQINFNSILKLLFVFKRIDKKFGVFMLPKHPKDLD